MKTKIPVLLLSLLWSAGYAQQTLQAEFLAALRANNTQIETIGCDFTQLKHNSLLAQDAESSGKFYFKRPGKLALFYDEPAGDRVVMGETSFLIVAGGSRSVVKIAANPFFLQMQQVCPLLPAGTYHPKAKLFQLLTLCRIRLRRAVGRLAVQTQGGRLLLESN